MKKILIIGCNEFVQGLIALNEATKSAGMILVHLSELRFNQEVPDPFFVPKNSFEFTIKGRPEIMEDLKIAYEKYGKLLLNPGSKYHK